MITVQQLLFNYLCRKFVFLLFNDQSIFFILSILKLSLGLFSERQGFQIFLATICIFLLAIVMQ